MMDLVQMFNNAADVGAADVHFVPGQGVRFCVEGRLIEAFPVGDDVLRGWVLDLVPADSRDRLVAGRARDAEASVVLGGVRGRVSVFSAAGELSAVVRLIAKQVPSLVELGAPSLLSRVLETLPGGLLLVSGATGEGKSTTLAALVREVLSQHAVHVVTIEDPIEFIHASALGVVSQREVGADVVSFAAGVKAALRQNPRVIQIGELRDLETIRMAMRAAETGHLVLGTLHAGNPAGAVARMVEVFDAEEKALMRAMLAQQLIGVVSQRLLPRVGGGRVANYEVMVATMGVRNTIREGRLQQLPGVIESGGEQEGMMTFEQHQLWLRRNGVVA